MGYQQQLLQFTNIIFTNVYTYNFINMRKRPNEA